MRLVEESVPEAKERISNLLSSYDISEDEQEELLNQHGILDDMWVTEDGSLMIFRYMHVSMEWLRNAVPDKTSLGIYWATKPTYPLGISKLNKGDHLILIQATLAPEYQSWEDILFLDYVGENEVRLGEGAKMTVVSIEIDEKEINLPNWIGKTYHA